MLQFLVPLRFGRQGFKLSDQFDHMSGALADVFLNGLVRIEHEVLGQIAHHEIASPRNITAVGRLQSREDTEKARFAATVAPNQANAVALVQRESGAIEDHAVVVAQCEFGGGENGGHSAESQACAGWAGSAESGTFGFVSAK